MFDKGLNDRIKSDQSLAILYHRIEHSKERIAFLIITFIGVYIRFSQYIAGRSLWFDEALLALNIVDRSFLELLLPLDNQQGAPIGFLWVEKTLVNFFGPSSYALRFFPFLSGVLAILFFWIIARRYLNQNAALFAFTLFIASDPLIYYASEAKQYSSDVLVGLIALYSVFRLTDENLNWFSSVKYGFLGAILIWTSHPVVFVLFSVIVASVYASLQERNYPHLKYLIAASLVWFASFIALYFVSLRYLTTDEALLSFWGDSFAPNVMNVRQFLPWLVDRSLKLFQSSAGLTLYGLGAFAYAVGFFSLWRENKVYLLSLFMPFAPLIIAAILRKYPYNGRLTLFLVPFLLLVLAKGAGVIYEIFSSKSLRIVGVCFALFLLLHPILQAASYLVRPHPREEIEPVIAYVRSNWKEGDIIYLYYAAQPAFRFYAPKYELSTEDCLVGAESRQKWADYEMDLQRLRDYDRVWLIFSHVYEGEGANEEKLFLHYLDHHMKGIQQDSLKVPGASVYLYGFAR